MAKATAELFKNRIIGYGTKPADQFTANPLNYRKHPQRQRDAVNASLRELGWISTVVENVTTGNVIDGHERIWQALQRNEDVPYLKVELSEAEERLALAVFDPLTNMAETDAAILDDLLREVNTGEAALQALLAELADGAGLYGDKGTEGDTPAEVDRAEELRQKWSTAPGQLWQLGEHRLICGDCTDPATVARVMGGEKAAAVVTDVPYGISQESNGLRRLDYGTWDDSGATDVAMAALGLCADVPTITAFCGDEQLSLILSLWKDRTKRTVAWVKPNPTVINGEHVFLPAVELAAHGRKSGAWFGGKCVRSVWEGTAPVNREHPTQKPLDLFVWLVELTCAPDAIVCEPFSGSGTTIIACENLGRRCRAVEISPAYVGVALERWAQHTGKTPVLIEGAA